MKKGLKCKVSFKGYTWDAEIISRIKENKNKYLVKRFLIGGDYDYYIVHKTEISA